MTTLPIVTNAQAAAPLPNGSDADETFLFTDIEGSTEKWEQAPQRMAQAVALHDALLRRAVESHGGRVIKTTGDGIYAAFTDVADGIASVVAIQLSLADSGATAGLPIVVRCGLHRGIAERRDNDYFGSTINRAARVMSAAHGGQVLISQAVMDAVAGQAPAETAFRDLGNVRLKGLAEPEHVYQVLHPRLRQDFPALRSLEATPNNLQQQATLFIGRETELGEAEALLRTSRLLTLLGMGGLGKTRLALQIGTDALDDFPDGVWFVDLAPISDPTLVAVETAKALRLREEPGASLVQTLASHLRTRKLLLILDNCEHLVGASASLADALLRAAPDVRIVATSREALHIPGEQVYPVLPLPVPERSASLEVLARSTAVRLFVERAQANKPSFALDERVAPAVAELVARLEGIPLALELAAARVRTLSVADINARLKERYKLLTGGGRVLLERQQTLRALVTWSYDLLNASEQRLLARLSVFAGGFALDSAEEVCGGEPLAPENVLDLVTSLVEKSLFMAEETPGGSRFRMLETIRDYAREKLVASDEHAAMARHHSDHFLVMAKAISKGLQGLEQADWTTRAEAEIDNLRAAIAMELDQGGDPIIAVKFAVAMQGFWMLRGYSTEGRRTLRTALARPEVLAFPVAHGHALYVGAALADGQGDYGEARRMLEECLALRRELGNPVDVAATLSTLSLVRLHDGDAVGARAGETEALAIFRALANRKGEAIALIHLGQIGTYARDDPQARTFLAQSLAIGREIGHREIESASERMLGEVDYQVGAYAAAREHLARSLAVCRDAADRQGEATALWWLGRVDVVEHDVESARIRLGGALRAFKAFEMYAEAIGCLEDHAELASPQDAAEGVRLLAAAATARGRLGLKRSPSSEQRTRDAISESRIALGDAEFEARWAEGGRLELDEAIRRASTLAAAARTD